MLLIDTINAVCAAVLAAPPNPDSMMAGNLHEYRSWKQDAVIAKIEGRDTAVALGEAMARWHLANAIGWASR